MHKPRLAALASAVDLLPDGAPMLSVEIGDDDDLDRLRRSIAELANRLALRHAQDQALAVVTQQVLRGVYLDDVLTHIYGGFQQLIPYDRIGCALLEDDGRSLRARWARSSSPKLGIAPGYHANIQGSSLEEMLQTGRPRILNDLREHLSLHPTSTATKLIVAEGMQSSLTCPLIALGKPLGFLFFSSAQRNCYAEVHTAAFERLAQLISTLIEKSLLYERLARSNSALLVAHDALQQEATHDALTGMLNRRAIVEHLDGRLAGWNERRGGAIVMLDIDHFKLVNDELGHPAGDAVLIAVARRIEAVLRKGDEVGRFGGEEFLVVLDQCTHASASTAAERILGVIRAAPIALTGFTRCVTASAGLATFDGAVDSGAESLIQRADVALYQAKRAGRDRLSDASLIGALP